MFPIFALVDDTGLVHWTGIHKIDAQDIRRELLEIDENWTTEFVQIIPE